MANREIFAKALPNVKLATRFDADGNEVQVERREDEEQNAKQQEIFEILVNAGYYRARIKGLSPFDKIVGGMTWCIECCDYDVDVDLLFHENLTIGQKIALVEKIVSVLPKMKCPYLIEPHQIQGLEFISIFPVIQWLVKKSVENRAERAAKLKAFAVSQFHNNFQYNSDKENLQKMRTASANIKRIQDMYSPHRQYKRKETGNEDEKTRVRITLLEYGNKGAYPGLTPNKNASQKSDDSQSAGTELDDNVVEREDDVPQTTVLDEKDKAAILKHYADLKEEMEIDTKLLSEQSQVKALENTKAVLDKKLLRVKMDNQELNQELEKQKLKLQEQEKLEKDLIVEIKEFEKIEAKGDKSVLEKIKGLVELNEQLKKEEAEYKDQCREELERLQKEIQEMEQRNAETNPADEKDFIAKQEEHLQLLRLQLAKKNRGIVAIQRQLDNVPDRTELAQYQRRFLELYNQVSAKHRETKQFYTLYNTLDDTKLYLEKELSLLNSIYENYHEGMTTPQSREQFLKQFEAIVDGVKQTHNKVRQKCDDEKVKRDALNSQLMHLVEQQRKYAAAVKQLTRECQRCEALMIHLKSIQ
ncbi:coiled-coil domain-containing protein 93 isoform X2 [Episyrphus balteatus]|uniref:coiled-coil domain-containing protein 93 isoform X2 n=1 Tax=Episyrphus balteatus TaxID=286459 RepID=UPI0024853395|nr:coiled-coil domain-containing protein 93 isoform X2 [Episyrphus balteatus]